MQVVPGERSALVAAHHAGAGREWGLVLGVAIEWVAVHIMERWTYTARMPLVPGLAVGIVPVVQMLVLPPLIFRGVAMWRHRTATPE